MKYMGSKNKISKYIAPIIQKLIDDNNIVNYLEPFVGGANMIDKIKCENKYGSDVHKYLIALLKHIQITTDDLPINITAEQYNHIKNNKDAYEDWYVGFVLFCGSFGGKFESGNARGKKNNGEPRNYLEESVRNLSKQKEFLQGINFSNVSFQDISKNIKNYIIYCDPPYKNTTKYKVNDFPYDEFYAWCKEMSKNNIVLVSEYNMPDDFECIWSKEVYGTIDCSRKANDCKNNRIEKLYIVKGGKDGEED